MANKRIIDQPTTQTLSSGDYVMVDSSTDGSRKYALGTALAGINDDLSDIGDLSSLETTAKSTLVDAINEIAEGGGGGGGSVDPYTSNPSALGTASPGSSSNYSRGDHVHPMPSASDIGALPSNTVIPTKTSDLTNDSGFITSESDPTVPSWAKASSKPSYTASEVGAIPAPSSPSTGAFLVWNGSAWVAQTLSTWQGGSF